MIYVKFEIGLGHTVPSVQNIDVEDCVRFHSCPLTSSPSTKIG